jgi:hypothetical protein
VGGVLMVVAFWDGSDWKLRFLHVGVGLLLIHSAEKP